MTLHQAADRVTSCASAGAASLVLSDAAHIKRGGKKNKKIIPWLSWITAKTRSVPEYQEFPRESFYNVK